ncbi:hypothetical protein LNP17_17525 [Klebsiella variicola subsp. variicola]|nr:hypothetical protein [Klebsiella variicola subsp. variicola]
MIILSLENFHDYQAAAELALRYQSLVVGFTSAGNVRRGRAFSRIPSCGLASGKAFRRLAAFCAGWPIVAGLWCRVISVRVPSSRQRAPLNLLEGG